MAGKIFINYRRADSAAHAMGIGQYLARAFGSRNVFVDIDMRSGQKFPQVLEQRLSQCKVMLALIGPGWLDARDDEGDRRLDDPTDWVRLEIVRALARDITVIPVTVGGAGLPKRSELPEPLRPLLDHQAASITTNGFPRDMAGLVKDIRAIPEHAGRWRWIGAGLAGAAALGVVVGWGTTQWSGRPDQQQQLATITEQLRVATDAIETAQRERDTARRERDGARPVLQSASPNCSSARPAKSGEAKAQSIRSMVVKLSAKVGTRALRGFGFIVGVRADGKVVIVTADHVVRGPPGEGGEDKNPQITFFQESGAPVVGELQDVHRSPYRGDIAVVLARPPRNLFFDRAAQAPRSVTGDDRGLPVWPVGRNFSWDVPVKPGIVKGVDPVGLQILVEDLPISEGSSGGPAVSQDGIIGMIATDNPLVGETEVLPIGIIQNVVQREWNMAWEISEPCDKR